MKATLLSLALLGVASAQNISSILTSNKETEDIREILSKFPGIAEVLGKAKGVTLFLPQDGARGLSQLANSVDRLKRIPGRVESTLQYHVATGLYPSTSIPTNAFVETLLSGGNYTSVTGGQKLQVSKAKTNGSRVYLNANGQRARVTQADIKFDGGLIHLIDAVLTPPTSPVSTARAAGLTSLTKALDDADLIPAVESARAITVFAPNNAAFFRARGPIGNFTDAQLADALKFPRCQGCWSIYGIG